MSIIKFIKIVPILILLIMACDQTNMHPASTTPEFLKDNKLHTILLTDSKLQQISRNYYYALLLIKQDYPNKNIEINIINEQEHTELVQKWQISKLPALIVIKNNKTLLSLGGEQNWEDIYQQMIKTLSIKPVQVNAKVN